MPEVAAQDAQNAADLAAADSETETGGTEEAPNSDPLETNVVAESQSRPVVVNSQTATNSIAQSSADDEDDSDEDDLADGKWFFSLGFESRWLFGRGINCWVISISLQVWIWTWRRTTTTRKRPKVSSSLF